MNIMNNSTRGNQNTYSLFRIVLDAGMSILYIVIAFFVMRRRSFGTIELSPAVGYALAGLLALYGAFRLYRVWIDIKHMRANHND
jgi:ABC-type nickel/cobalt efflux system permease component RcnA